MALDKPIKVDSANPSGYTMISPATTSAGAADAGRVVALNASGLLDPTLIPGSTATTFPATENLASGAIVSVWLSGGVASIRNADQTAVGKRADGFVPAAITSGNSGTVYLGSGENTSLSGLTIGSRYYLGTAGAVTTTAPSASASIIQYVGFARSATELSILIGAPTLLT